MAACGDSITTRPTAPAGEMTAMSVCTPSLVPRSMVTLRKSAAGLVPITSAASVGIWLRSRRSSSRRRLSASAASARSRWIDTCSWRSCCLQRLVLGVHALQRRVLVPRAAHAADDRRRPALHLGEHAEDGRLQHRHARPRVHLRGDQDDVAGRERQEQQAAPPPDIGDGHRTERTASGGIGGSVGRRGVRPPVLRPSRPRLVDRDLPEQIEVRQHLAGAEHDRRQRVLGHRHRAGRSPRAGACRGSSASPRRRSSRSRDRRCRPTARAASARAPRARRPR